MAASDRTGGCRTDDCTSPALYHPHRAGKPVFAPLAGCHGTRPGTYRIVFRIDESSRILYVLDVDLRSEFYYRPQR